MNSGKIVFTGCALFDGYDLYPALDNVVVVEGAKVIEVCTGGYPDKKGEQVIDLQGKTLMPGLIDAHFHCNSPSLDVGSIDGLFPSHLAQHARAYLEETLSRGFTTVRDAGGADSGLVDATEAGIIKGPRLFISGKALSQTGGHGDMRKPAPFDVCGCSYKGALSKVVDGADSVRRAVRNELHNGAHQIKIFVSGGVLSPTDPIWMNQFTDGEILAAVEEAASRRTYVMAHAHTAEAAMRCSRLGVRSIEHGTMIDALSAAAVAENETFVVPTLTVVEALISGNVDLPAGAYDKLAAVSDYAYAAVEHCEQAGVKLGLGTDLFGGLHGQELWELVLRARISGALETLRSATSVNGELLQRKDKLGVVKPGALADLIVVDGNPIQNVELFLEPAKNIQLIMKNGDIEKDITSETKPHAGQGV